MGGDISMSSSSLLSSKSLRPTSATDGTLVVNARWSAGSPVPACRELLPQRSRRMCSMSGTGRAPSPDSTDCGKYRELGFAETGDGRTGLGVVKRDDAGDIACVTE